MKDINNGDNECGHDSTDECRFRESDDDIAGTFRLFEFETACLEQQEAGNGNWQQFKMRVPMQAEIRSLDFWRSIVAECLASFFLVFIVCGSFIPWSGHTPPAISIALASGFAVAALTLSFAQISVDINRVLGCRVEALGLNSSRHGMGGVIIEN
ncbi:hypothetical protein DAPPUDRAFT_261670 [Daphnia pulex]|uniref:Uncharacterized protein n=1 Tax=Daphnia pulex TaxID=6669 RepID=E9HLF1_DAPPU|nr:hypothetical protein DAPPUDRAFT_261670 [Daphnia pulex]|eukprot:EFX67428.1 hypothetical protein DAPPUDRAFT_261670 [Daphnia pulex]